MQQVTSRRPLRCLLLLRASKWQSLHVQLLRRPPRIHPVTPPHQSAPQNLKIATNFFARLGRVFWACSHFILFQWMKILSKYFAGFDLGVLRNADLNWFISAEEQKWRRPPSKRTFIEVCFQGFSWLRFFCSKYFREAALSEGTIACQQWRRQRFLKRRAYATAA